jgi:hypothetical protein
MRYEILFCGECQQNNDGFRLKLGADSRAKRTKSMNQLVYAVIQKVTIQDENDFNLSFWITALA